MSHMQIEVQQSLGNNPLYNSLDFSGPPVRIDQTTFSHLVHADLRWAAEHGGNLPSGNEPGGHFGDWVRWKWLGAVESGHEARFDINHCPELVQQIERDYTQHIFLPPPPPPTCPPISECLPTPPQPSPGNVPEPAAAILLSLGMVFIYVLLGWRRKT